MHRRGTPPARSATSGGAWRISRAFSLEQRADVCGQSVNASEQRQLIELLGGSSADGSGASAWRRRLLRASASSTGILRKSSA